MDKRHLRLLGLKALLVIREIDATFCDLGLAGTKATPEDRANYRNEFIPQIELRNRQTCLAIADIYRDMKNEPMERKYLAKSEMYAPRAVSA